ncbi:MAG: adenine deaminase [Cytophagales bacterium]|nr:adenine deaminase [Bernardetiaceae bacterium]MDW8205518.1 adenine deaminase [Cytophagales bacterium]
MNHPVCIRANVVNIAQRHIFPAEVHISEGIIAAIRPMNAPCQHFLLPGFIDAHVHIESSMLVPAQFARLATLHGTVATVSDPHEIANVMGIEGVRYMVHNGNSVPFKFFFGAPSCVPATGFETAGATLHAEQIRELFQKDRLKYLAEMMNYPGVLHQNEEVMAKIDIAKSLGKPIDGHAPGLCGELARQYAAAGISTDHECYTAQEALDKLAAGMKIIIREGSAAKNFDALAPLLDQHWQQMMFCSDDKHPDSLVEGHINQLAARAVALGLDVFKVLQAACLNPIHHYGLEVGQLRIGDPADCILVEDLTHFKVLQTWINGKLVAENGVPLIKAHHFTQKPNHFCVQPIQQEDLRLKATSNLVRTIVAYDGQLITGETYMPVTAENGWAIADPTKDLLKIVVVNRYRSAAPAIGFVKGFGLQCGAIASSVAHDSHNIVAVGTNDELLCRAINAVIAAKGGIAACSPHTTKLLPLPIAGLMSDQDAYYVAHTYQEIDSFAKTLCAPYPSAMKAPFMTLSFMALLVIPSLKMSDLGLFNGNKFEFSQVFC